MKPLCVIVAACLCVAAPKVVLAILLVVAANFGIGLLAEQVL